MRRIVSAVILASAVLVGACGSGGTDDDLAAPPPAVPVALVPAGLEQNQLLLQEDGPATEAFSTVGPRALIADGRLWQLRQENKLVGTLQISTLKRRVQIDVADQRTSIVNSVLPGAKQEIEIAGVDVVTADSNDKTVYIWFAEDLFQVLQLKGTTIDPEAIATELLTFQTSSPDWRPLDEPDPGLPRRR